MARKKEIVIKLVKTPEFPDGEGRVPVKTKVATKKGCYLEKTPTQFVVIPLNIIIPSSAMSIVKYGRIPEIMEHRWFMYCDKTTIRYFRSWTGICIYIARYKDDGQNCRITSLKVNRDPEQYCETDNKRDVALFLTLLFDEFGNDTFDSWGLAEEIIKRMDA